MVNLKIITQQTIQLNTLTKEHDYTLTFGTHGSQGMFVTLLLILAIGLPMGVRE
jgi:hypothetical protein